MDIFCFDCGKERKRRVPTLMMEKRRKAMGKLGIIKAGQDTC